ncbi:ribulokinase [Luteolibacter arcticus]|uniref:Ribulokinase n=1 Tax=Luteolibacter arcticus TaxID=1581411 RepID=A0ABT3GK68_9BACT|nr:ribulokinase [Luteolibacter arcticus]MCW1923913.1 ribulokinase [Luteolibacter arcticus]
MPYTLGLDYGTNSARALVVDCSDGREVGTAVVDYPSGNQGVILNPADHHLARQNPADYLHVLERATQLALDVAMIAEPSFSKDQIIGIGMDGTGSSPLPVDRHNRPLTSDPRFSNNPNAHCWLWKDHTSIPEAAAITATARRLRPHYLAKIGGTYSSEWFWAKIWHCLKVDPDVFEAAWSWVELADFVPAVLAGVTDPLVIRRGVCMAGHKAMYADEWGGLPDQEFLAALDPALSCLRDRLYTKAHDASAIAGHLCPEWADKLGLAPGIPIAIGEMDVHYGAIGCGIDEGTLVKVIGTSTCDCAVVSAGKTVADIPGICGIVKGSILPGYSGIEAGQSAVGDIFKWFVEGVLEDGDLHGPLTADASALKPGQAGLLALDWNNGNRTILVDQRLTGLILGQTLYTTRAEIYRALIEATAFGARVIIDRLRDHDVPVERIVCSGGIAEKNPLLMQIYADVTGCEMSLSRSSQACALGSAIAAAVVAGAHPDFATAQAAMTGLKDTTYRPIPRNRDVYQELYDLYRSLHDAFGGVTESASLGHVMKDLLSIKARQSL